LNLSALASSARCLASLLLVLQLLEDLLYAILHQGLPSPVPFEEVLLLLGPQLLQQQKDGHVLEYKSNTSTQKALQRQQQKALAVWR
jgi:hypothetical protein